MDWKPEPAPVPYTIHSQEVLMSIASTMRRVICSVVALAVLLGGPGFAREHTLPIAQAQRSHAQQLHLLADSPSIVSGHH